MEQHLKSRWDSLLRRYLEFDGTVSEYLILLDDMRKCRQQLLDFYRTRQNEIAKQIAGLLKGTGPLK